MRRVWIFLLGGCAACGGSGCGGSAGSAGSPGQAGPERGAASTKVEAPAPRPARELIVGRWRMIAEESPTPGEGVAHQGRRLLEIRADGSFEAENYIEQLTGQWQLDGEALALGEVTVQLVDVGEERLVLIEDVPEVYLRGGPPQKAKIIYRRVSERELGPMLGRELAISAPKAGSYAAAYAYRMHKYPTMEIYISEQIDGRATLVLGPDHSATGCFGVAHNEHSSISKYASDDGEHHTREHDERWLVGFRGEWTTSGEQATVKAARTWRGSCAESDDPYNELGGLELECQAIAANDALPVAVLACRIVEGLSVLEQLALNPADTERSGPYTLQSDPLGHISTDPGRPWLMFGAAPGVRVESEDDRDSTTPQVSFAAGPVDFVEASYVPDPHSKR